MSFSLMLTGFRYTLLPSYVEIMKSIKNEVELDGLLRTYVRDGAAFVRFLAWLEQKIMDDYEITEYEAAWRLAEYRRMGMTYMGLAYESISASVPKCCPPSLCTSQDYCSVHRPVNPVSQRFGPSMSRRNL